MALLILALSLAWTAEGQDAAYWLDQTARDYANGSYSLALDDIDNYLEHNSSDINGWNIKANILLKMERYIEAAECFEREIALDKSNAKALNDLGIIQAGALGEPEIGLESLDRAVEIDPDFAHAWYNRGLVLESMNEYNASLESFAKATALDPSIAKAWFHQGVVLEKLGDYNAAAAAFDEAVEEEPDYAEAWNEKGLMLLDSQDYEGALECFNKVTMLEPRNKAAWNSKGSALQALKRGQEAMEAFSKAGMMPGR